MEETVCMFLFLSNFEVEFLLVLFRYMVPLCSISTVSIFPNYLDNISFFNNANNVDTLIISTWKIIILCLDFQICAKVINLMVMV